ncbi:MAG: DNA-directed RNA polymerase subunit omega [Candidatus Poribacteria bacterium]
MKTDLELINEVLEKMPNKYEAVIVAAKRTRELNTGAKPLVKSDANKLTTIALQEVAEGAIVSGPAKHPELILGEPEKHEFLPSTELALEGLDVETEEIIKEEIPQIQDVNEDLEDDFDDDDISFDHIDIDDSFEDILGDEFEEDDEE